MAAGTQAVVLEIPNKIMATVENVESGCNILYFGTDVGDVYKYNQTTAVLTKLGNTDGLIQTMSLYSSALYIGMSDGKMVSMTVS